MSEYDDQEDECTFDDDGECDDACCEHRREFEVSITRIVELRVLAHSEDEATAIVDNLDVFIVREPSDDLVEEFTDNGDDVDVRDALEAEADRRRWAAEVARITAETADA